MLKPFLNFILFILRERMPVGEEQRKREERESQAGFVLDLKN